MKKVVTWSEFTELYPREYGFDCDKWSRIIIKYLLQWGFGTTNINVQFTEGNNCSDLSWVNPVKGTKLIGEIKDRYTYDSTAFNDHIVEDIKVKSLVNKIKKGLAVKAAIFSIYNDGVIKVTVDILKQGSFLGQQQSVCPITTTLGDNTPITKTLYKFRPDSQYYFRFQYDDETNQYTIECSNKPFELNATEFISRLDF